jgi:hypothetical protein
MPKKQNKMNAKTSVFESYPKHKQSNKIMMFFLWKYLNPKKEKKEKCCVE